MGSVGRQDLRCAGLVADACGLPFIATSRLRERRLGKTAVSLSELYFPASIITRAHNFACSVSGAEGMIFLCRLC